MANNPNLSMLWRIYIYALHGYFCEILFTAAWEFVVTQKYTLMGATSLWTLPIYGVSGLVVEKLYFYTKQDLQLPLPLRCVFYLLWTYLWEFSTGYVLSLFNACPWNYEAYDYDYMGLICLEYSLLWYFASMLYDQLLLPYTLSLQWATATDNGLYCPKSS